MTLAKKRVFGGIGVVLAVLVGGVYALSGLPLAVSVVGAEPDVPIRIYGLGTVEARIVSKTGFEVGGALTELIADSGDTVRRGQVLARLNPVVQEARLLRAKAAVEAGEANLRKADANAGRARAVLAQREAANARQQELAGRNAISTQTAEEAQRDVDVAAAELSVAESEIDVVKAQVADTRAAVAYDSRVLAQHELKAPFDGVIVERHAEAGMVVRAGDPIFTLMDPETVWTLAYVDEERAGSLAVGQAAEIRLRSLPHDVFEGTVSRVGIESDRVNEERRVWINCTICPRRAFLGEQAEVRITVAILDSALLVPETAISGFNGHTGKVWIVAGGKLTEVELVFGHRTEDARVEVVSGLPDGARIVSAPVKGLAEGRSARIAGELAP